MALYSKDSKDTWRFTAKQQSKEVSGGKLLRGDIKERGFFPN